VGVAEHLTAAVEDLFKQRLGLAIVPLAAVEAGQVAEGL
jgi:hypothetical protein